MSELSKKLYRTSIIVGDVFYSDAAEMDINVEYRCVLTDPEIFLNRLSDKDLAELESFEDPKGWAEDYINQNLYSDNSTLESYGLHLNETTID